MAHPSLTTFHALTRFGHGSRPGDLRVSRDRDWVAAQLDTPDPTVSERLAGLGAASDRVLALAEMRAADDPETQEAYREDVRTQFRAEQAIHLHASAASATPFVEQLVQFWFDHLTVSIERRQVAPLASAYERDVIRGNLGRSFGDMLLASAKHPAMLVYLDNARSVGPNSAVGQRRERGLNENYARELLELHTIGVNGGYSQSDVVAVAKLFTGWTLSVGPAGGMAAMVGATGTGEFTYRPERHEPGPQTVLGTSYLRGEDLLRDLARHPATARFVATKLARRFVADDPPGSAIDKLTAAFLGSEGHLPTVHRALAALDEAWEHPLAKVKTPLNLVFSMSRSLDRMDGEEMLKALFFLGHLPASAPSPAGWPDRQEEWIHPGAMLRRVELAARAGRLAPRVDAAALADDLLGPVLSATTRASVRNAGSNGLSTMFACPEFQRR